MRHWLGTFLHLLYPPLPDAQMRALIAQMEERREHMATLSASRAHLERLAADPLDATLQSIIKDL